MRRFWDTKAYILSCLLAAGGLMLASCQTHMDKDERAFGQATQQRLANSFHQQIAELSQAEKHLPATGVAPKMPADPNMWWTGAVCAKLFENSTPVTYTLENLYVRALAHSSQIKVFSDIPLIRETGIQEARGVFDTRLFAETAYEYTNEPVSSSLKTFDDRFKEWDMRAEAGIRKKLVTGADVTLSEEIRRTTSNSLGFDPHSQAAARLALTISQPLLRGAGCEYNRAHIRIAKIDTEIARNEFIRQAEGHLLMINQAYWNLYFARATCLQTQKLVKDTAEVVVKLEKRTDIDQVGNSDLMRAKAALSKRKADLVRAEVAVKNAEDRIKALLDDPTLLPSPQAELLPANEPSLRPINIDMKQAAATALENRPEILQAFLQLKAAAIRKDVSKNELLPQLDLILAASLMGLDKAGGFADGFDDQFKSPTHPGFLVGLRLERPVENNTAKAVYLRRRLEIRQQLADLQTTVDTVLLEVKISAREVMTAYREMATRYEALQASDEDVRVLTNKWDPSVGPDKSFSGYLQLLVDAQDRRAEAEAQFTRSSVLYNVAAIALQRAQGTLLKYEDLQINRTRDDAGLPVVNISKKPDNHLAPAAPVAPATPAAPATGTAPAKVAAAAKTAAAPAKTAAPASAAKPAAAPIGKANTTSAYQPMMVAPAKPTTFAPAAPAATTPAGRAAADAVVKRAMTSAALPPAKADAPKTIDRWVNNN
jgi:outer membrane protein TolC